MLTCERCDDCGEVVSVWHGDHWTERPASLSTLGTLFKVWRDRRPCPDCNGKGAVTTAG